MKFNLTMKIFLGMVLGVIVGILLHPYSSHPFVKTYILDSTFYILGTGFMNIIKMIVSPLVFISVTLGTFNMEDVKKLGRVGLKTFIFYLSTTAIAISLALFVASFFNFSSSEFVLSSKETVTSSAPNFIETLLNIIPTNIFNSFAKGNMLQIIFLAILFGITLAILEDKVAHLKKIIDEINTLLLKVVDIIMHLAPFGVFALIGKTFILLGITAILSLFKYFIVVVIVLALHFFIVYQGLLLVYVKYNPINFIKKFSSVMMMAFSTSSSSATLPSSMECIQNKFGVSKGISSFTLSLGSTVNMDGTAIMQGVATVFISQLAHIQLTPSQYIAIILTATLASIGTAGVPGVGAIMLSMVLKEVGLPLEGIALVLGVDKFVDMFRTVTNITGDAVCTLAIAKSEKENIL